jgi:hypothetical protein
MEIRAPEFEAMLSRYLAPRVRYRTVLFTSTDWAILSLLGDCFRDLYPNGSVLADADFFDRDATVVSARAALEKIKERAKQGLLLIEGPWHACDSWSPTQLKTVWQELSTFSAGVGIVVLDRNREEVTRSLFCTAERMTTAEVVVLRSQLTQKEVG